MQALHESVFIAPGVQIYGQVEIGVGFENQLAVGIFVALHLLEYQVKAVAAHGVAVACGAMAILGVFSFAEAIDG